jgi:hypothetical protein
MIVDYSNYFYMYYAGMVPSWVFIYLFLYFFSTPGCEFMYDMARMCMGFIWVRCSGLLFHVTSIIKCSAKKVRVYYLIFQFDNLFKDLIRFIRSSIS